MEDYLVVRAALRDELSRPMAELRRQIREAAGDTRRLAREQDANARSAARLEAAQKRLKGSTDLVTGSLRSAARVGALGLTAALGGLAVMAFKVGGDYRATMNEFGAVTGATATQLAAVGQTAKDLGAATDLANVSAADAASVMVELAKGGLSVADSMAAAKGTLQLAGAAQIDAAQAATIQAAALNQFSLAGDQAGRVADVLANTANAAAGGVEDIGLALSYAGPVAASLSESIENTAASIGILSNAGVGGEKAGTALRAVLAGLAAPTKQSAGGLRDLGIEAFDAQGRFKGLRYVSEQLRVAQGKLTEEQFAAAAATAFGREPLAAVVALAKGGAPAFDAMATAVARQGGAADVAAAKTKGLRGALENVRGQLETVAIGVYERVEPSLERVVRGIAGSIDPLADAGFALVDGIDWESVGGDLAAGLSAAGRTIAPIVDEFQQLGGAVKDLAGSATTGGSGLNTLLVGAATTGKAAASGLGLVVDVAGDALSLFNSLPGPVQAVVVALTAMSFVQPILHQRLTQTVDRVRAAGTGIRAFGDQMRVQQALAAAQGQEIGRLGAAYSTLVARTGGLRGVGSALLGAVGGPVGLAITAATVGLGLLASAHAKAQAKVAENAAAQRSYADALDAANGAQDVQVVKMATTNLQNAKAFQFADKLGISYDSVAAAALKGGDAQAQLSDRLATIARTAEAADDAINNMQPDKATEYADALARMGVEYKSGATRDAAQRLSAAVAQEAENVAKGTKAYQEQAAVRRALGFSTELSTANTSKLGEAIGVLADNAADATSKTSALRTAVDLLQGREVDLTTVQAQMYEQVQALGASGADFSKVVDQQTNAINVSSEAGRTLNSSLNAYRDVMASTTLAAYQNARAQGQDLPAAYAAAEQAGNTARGELTRQLEQMGLNGDAASRLADKYGLVTGDFVATIRANVDPAESALAAFQERWTRQPFIVQAQVRTSGVPYAPGYTPGATTPSAPGVKKQAMGGLLEFYASGGLRSAAGLSPMSADVATVVAPNTWRVIGDRPAGDEAFIPINRSARSMEILAETASRMGRKLQPFADGAVASAVPAQPQGSSSGGAAPTVTIQVNGAQDPAAVAAEVEARLPRIMAAVQREMKERG